MSPFASSPASSSSASRRSQGGPAVSRLLLLAAAAAAVGGLLLAHGAVVRMADMAAAGGSASDVVESSFPLGPGVEDGIIGDEGASVDDDVPALRHLDPALRDALHRAADAAEADGIRFIVNSGWRSARLQEKLLADAVDDYGSREEAARWVASPDTSAHVTGDAVDIGGWDATDWLQRRGAAFGLCQIYDNERWHFELRPDAVDSGCPVRFPDPTYDPRMR